MRTIGKRARLFVAAAALSGALFATGASSPAGASVKPTATGTTISESSSPYGNVLVAGSGPFAGFSLYFISSDSGGRYGCTTHVVIVLGVHELSCIDEWPPLLTSGTPVAGTGVDQSLLGSVWRPSLGASQVTYKGHPLYLFDNAPGQFTGEGFDEPSVPPWHGNWYLISPAGAPVVPVERIKTETINGSDTVLGAVKRTLLGSVTFTVYTFSGDTYEHSNCRGACAAAWMPVLSSGPAKLQQGFDARDFGTITLPDGTDQVTFDGQPLYLYSNEAVALGSTGPVSEGNGNGLAAFGGTFNVVGAGG